MNYETLVEKLIAVHCTSILPISGKLIPGHSTAEYLKKLYSISKLPNQRVTLHWSLGNTVNDEFFESSGAEALEYMNAKPKQYAIVTRLKNLVPQLATLFMSDTFIVGEYHLSKKDILVIPEDTEIAGSALERSGVQIITYNPTSERLNSVIKKIIGEIGGWHTLFHDYYNQATIPALKSQDVNCREFFEPILTRYPHVTFAVHCGSLFGYMEEIINYIAVILLDNNDRDYHVTSQIGSYYAHISILQEFREWLAKSHVDPVHKLYCVNRLQRESKWINLVVLELQLLNIGYKLSGALCKSIDFREGILQRLDNYDVLLKYIKEHHKLIAKYYMSYNAQLTDDDFFVLIEVSNMWFKKYKTAVGAMNVLKMVNGGWHAPEYVYDFVRTCCFKFQAKQHDSVMISKSAMLFSKATLSALKDRQISKEEGKKADKEFGLVVL